jgi:hypothetical protein
MGATWMLHNGVPGAGSSDATLIAFHRSAIGHAYAKDSLRPKLGENEEDDYQWVRSSIYMGAKKLQNNGIVLAHHNDSSMIGS